MERGAYLRVATQHVAGQNEQVVELQLALASPCFGRLEHPLGHPAGEVAQTLVESAVDDPRRFRLHVLGLLLDLIERRFRPVVAPAVAGLEPGECAEECKRCVLTSRLAACSPTTSFLDAAAEHGVDVSAELPTLACRRQTPAPQPAPAPAGRERHPADHHVPVPGPAAAASSYRPSVAVPAARGPRR